MERRGRLFLSVDRVKNPNFFGVSDFFRSSGVFLDINLFFFFFFFLGNCWIAKLMCLILVEIYHHKPQVSLVLS